jgi:hypothetical protein
MTETEQETEQKPTCTVSAKKRRTRLFTVLDNIIGFSEEKRVLKGNSDRAKQQWSRIAVSAISAYGSLLHDCELEDIEKRLDVLESERETRESLR